MTNLLLRLFVPGSPTDARGRARVGRLSGAVGIGANVLLFLAKLLLGVATGAVSVTADALNNLSDASSAIVTYLGFRLAEKPADEEHPYGHARLEYLSALAVAVLILFIGFELAKSSVSKILNPADVTFSLLSGLILLGTILVKLWMYGFNTRLGRLIESPTLLATAADSRNDVLTTGAVLVAMVVEHFTKWRVDGFMGLAVAVFILISGLRLARQTVSPLLGEAADPDLREKLVDYIRSDSRVLGYHDLMVHDYGPGQRFASIHVEMDARADPLLCHEIIDDMERECFSSHGVHLVIHYDPIITDDPILTRLKEAVGEHLRRIDSRLSLHDFRMVPGRQHTNLIFDVSLPTELYSRREWLRQELERRMNDQGEERYHIHITFDPAAFNEN